jgi:hypothetical protein
MVPFGWYVDSDAGSIGVEEFCLHPAIMARKHAMKILSARDVRFMKISFQVQLLGNRGNCASFYMMIGIPICMPPAKPFIVKSRSARRGETVVA